MLRTGCYAIYRWYRCHFVLTILMQDQRISLFLPISMAVRKEILSPKSTSTAKFGLWLVVLILCGRGCEKMKNGRESYADVSLNS